MVKKIQKKICENKEKILFYAGTIILGGMLLLWPENVFAANATSAGEQAIKNSFGNFYSLVVALVSSVGSIFLLWGFFEFGTSLQSPNGTEQSQAFKRIGGGLLMVIAPSLAAGFLA